MTQTTMTKSIKEMAEEEYPFEHVGYSMAPPLHCGCDECYVTTQLRLAYIDGCYAGMKLTEENVNV